MSEKSPQELTDRGKWAFGNLLLTHAALYRNINETLIKQTGVSMEVYDILLILEDAPGQRLRVCALAEMRVFSPSATTRIVDRLESAGYLKREADPDDRRATQVVLTAKGLDTRERVWPVYRELIQKWFGEHLDPIEEQYMLFTLRKLFTANTGREPLL